MAVHKSGTSYVTTIVTNCLSTTIQNFSTSNIWDNPVNLTKREAVDGLEEEHHGLKT